jgi:glutathione S-transferase
MRLIYAPQSPFARKVRAAATELKLGDRIALDYAEVLAGKPNAEPAQAQGDAGTKSCLGGGTC